MYKQSKGTTVSNAGNIDRSSEFQSLRRGKIIAAPSSAVTARTLVNPGSPPPVPTISSSGSTVSLLAKLK